MNQIHHQPYVYQNIESNTPSTVRLLKHWIKYTITRTSIKTLNQIYHQPYVYLNVESNTQSHVRLLNIESNTPSNVLCWIRFNIWISTKMEQTRNVTTNPLMHLLVPHHIQYFKYCLWSWEAVCSVQCFWQFLYLYFVRPSHAN